MSTEMTINEYRALPEAERPRGGFIAVGNWSGNVRPWRAVAYYDGKYVGCTGFCTSPGRAHNKAAEQLLSRK